MTKARTGRANTRSLREELLQRWRELGNQDELPDPVIVMTEQMYEVMCHQHHLDTDIMEGMTWRSPQRHYKRS